jgi:alpha 1,6-mannosyltransferase
MTDISGDIYVKKTFKSRPEIIEAYLALAIPILKADLLRYLLLFADGGIWRDLHVSCEDVPIHDWIPAQYRKDASLVVGWELDVGWGVMPCANLPLGQ